MNDERDEDTRELTLEARLRMFRSLSLPGQPKYLHMGTSYLVEDLWTEIKQLRVKVAQKPPPQMEVKCLEIRDRNTFIPVLCIRPVPRNDEQRYLLRCDGYRGANDERCIIMIGAQCRGVAYDPYYWPANPRTHRVAHHHITEHWFGLIDGDVIDVEFILGETTEKKTAENERVSAEPRE